MTEDERSVDYDPTCGGCVAGTNPWHLHRRSTMTILGDGPATPDNRTMAQAIRDAVEGVCGWSMTDAEAESAVAAAYAWSLSRGIDIAEFQGHPEGRPYTAVLGDFRKGVLPLSDAIREAEADA